VTGKDLRPRDPEFDIAYERFYGRTGRGGGRVAKILF